MFLSRGQREENFGAVKISSPTPLTNQSGKLKYATDSPKRFANCEQLNRTSNDVLLQTDFPQLQLFASGKVRDLYKVGDDRLLFVATDRISAFDYVLATGIPQKGRVLTQLSLFWFDFLKDIVPNHLATADVRPISATSCRAYAASTARPLDAGGARRHGAPSNAWCAAISPARAGRNTRPAAPSAASSCPPGLRESDKLPEPIFTPATKAASGHDENISFDHMV